VSKIAVIIPAKNEEDNIGKVVEDVIRNVPHCEIVVIDDHSTDETGLRARAHKNVMVLTSPIALGIGGAVQLGIRFGLEAGFTTFVRIDGDGQHDASYIPKLLSKVSESTLVIGARNNIDFMGSSDFIRKIGWYYFKLLFRLFTGKKVCDPTSGFMCFGKTIAEKFAGYFPLDYPEIEGTMLLLRAGFDVKYEEVRMNPRKKGKSSISIFYSMVYMVAVSIAFFISFFKKNQYKV
jgi:glycosyltransferase involved in cell wall biosynthesis